MENPEWIDKILELVQDVKNNNINNDGEDTNDN